MPKTYDVRMYNSTVNSQNNKFITGVYGNSSKMKFYGTTFNNVNNYLAANASIGLHKSAVNISTYANRKTINSLVENGSYLTRYKTTFNVGYKRTAPYVTPISDYKPTGFKAPIFTGIATPGI